MLRMGFNSIALETILLKNFCAEPTYLPNDLSARQLPLLLYFIYYMLNCNRSKTIMKHIISVEERSVCAKSSWKSSQKLLENSWKNPQISLQNLSDYPVMPIKS